MNETQEKWVQRLIPAYMPQATEYVLESVRAEYPDIAEVSDHRIAKLYNDKIEQRALEMAIKTIKDLGLYDSPSFAAGVMMKGI